ncbi:MAG TPA: alpha/beta hydrolase [Bacteroidales bacterium]|nr:alpha/beta hydrolase [Bacteroidales bacterium]
MPRARKAIIIAAGLILFSVAAITYVLPRIVIEINGGLFSYFLKDYSFDTLNTPEKLGLNFKELTTISRDNLKLKSILVLADSSNEKGTIIFLHGIRRHKEQFMPVAKLLSERGFNSLIPDLRSHGESEGKYITYGYFEKQDVCDLIDSVIIREKLKGGIGIWGQSMGAAIAIQAMAIDNRIDYGIFESTFSDLPKTVKDYLKRDLGFYFDWIGEFSVWRAGKIAGFNPQEISPLKIAERISKPILMVHGKLDKKININDAVDVFKKLSSPEKEFLTIPSAGHLDVWKKGGQKYFDSVFEFIEGQSAAIFNLP